MVGVDVGHGALDEGQQGCERRIPGNACPKEQGDRVVHEGDEEVGGRRGARVIERLVCTLDHGALVCARIGGFEPAQRRGGDAVKFSRLFDQHCAVPALRHRRADCVVHFHDSVRIGPAGHGPDDDGKHLYWLSRHFYRLRRITFPSISRFMRQFMWNPALLRNG